MDRRILIAVSASITFGALLLAYGLDQQWFGMSVVSVIGLVGGFGWYSKRPVLSDWLISIVWVGIVLAVIMGVLLNLNTILLIFTVIGGLAAWDLVRFDRALAGYPVSEVLLQIEKRHLLLLGSTLLIGGILAVIVTAISVQISFFWVLLLGVVLIFTLSLLVRLMQKES